MVTQSQVDAARKQAEELQDQLIEERNKRDQDAWEIRTSNDHHRTLNDVLEAITNFQYQTERNTFDKVIPLLRNVLQKWPARKVL